MASPINRALMRLPKRAESNELETLVQTFVDVGPLFTLLSSQDHQIFYGRRGTGKTHALLYLGEHVNREGGRAIYVDLRKIGSTGGIYADSSIALAERGTRLLLDVLGCIHNELVDFVLDRSYVDADYDPTVSLRLLDRLAESITEVRVVGDVTMEEARSSGMSNSEDASIALGVSSTPEISVRFGSNEGTYREATTRSSTSGELVHRVHFGNVNNLIGQVVEALPISRLWLLLDEWSAVPIELQPYLADLLRRSVFPVSRMTVKVASIEQRSSFRISRGPGDYTGIELGADASAELDLDDFMVFGNSAELAKEFFKELLFRHFLAVIAPEFRDSDAPKTSDELIRAAFTQRNAFDEFVRTAEGVPRDAINVLSLAAQSAGNSTISVQNIRNAARTWYLRDKESAVGANADALSLLHWIIDTVIGTKQTKGFLLDQREGTSNTLVGHLYDERVLHVVRRGISSRDQPGVRFNAYGLDYGCYVHLTAARSPRGLFEAEDTDGEIALVEVPSDDYRSIRTALLDLSAYYSAHPA
jgi:hypothetical protein